MYLLDDEVGQLDLLNNETELWTCQTLRWTLGRVKH